MAQYKQILQQKIHFIHSNAMYILNLHKNHPNQQQFHYNTFLIQTLQNDISRALQCVNNIVDQILRLQQSTQQKNELLTQINSSHQNLNIHIETLRNILNNLSPSHQTVLKIMKKKQAKAEHSPTHKFSNMKIDDEFSVPLPTLSSSMSVQVQRSGIFFTEQITQSTPQAHPRTMSGSMHEHHEARREHRKRNILRFPVNSLLLNSKLLSDTFPLPGSTYKFPFPGEDTHMIYSALHINFTKKMPQPIVTPETSLSQEYLRNRDIEIKWNFGGLPKGCKVRYTIDGSLPTSSIGKIYTNEARPTITNNMIFRAVLYAPGWKESDVVNCVYIVDESENSILNNPILRLWNTISNPMSQNIQNKEGDRAQYQTLQHADNNQSKNISNFSFLDQIQSSNLREIAIRPNSNINVPMNIDLGLATPGTLGRETPTPNPYMTPVYYSNTPSYIHGTPTNRKDSALSSSSSDSSF